MLLAFALLQGLLDLILVAAAWVWYRAYRREQAERERVTACLNVLESHGSRHEQEWNVLRSQLQEQLRALHGICEEAKEILSQGQSALSASGNSREERELAEAALPVPPEPVPTVSEVETAQSRPKPQGWLDLKTLLREQLV
jgi:beta-phosphoglucomutase-like phosphatase (HAD superfamily)